MTTTDLWDSAGPAILGEWIRQMRALAFNDDLGGNAGWAEESLVWHLLSTDDTLDPSFDWLNGSTPGELAADGLAAAAAALAARFGTADPASWKDPIQREHYQRLNFDLVPDTVQSELGLDRSGDGRLPGDVQDLIKMDRGTYNHVVTYTDEPSGSGVLGESGSEAGSVIPPGQSGFISLLLQEDEHYEDQLALYLEWRYKPMPLSLEEARALAESEITLTRT